MISTEYIADQLFLSSVNVPILLFVFFSLSLSFTFSFCPKSQIQEVITSSIHYFTHSSVKMHYYTSLFALVGALVLPTITGSPVSPRDNITRDTASYSAVSLSSHNTYRQKHSAANLTWDATLAGYAATSANTCNLGIDM